MDKSKLAAIAILVALGGALFLSKSQDAPAPEADPDHKEETSQSAPAKNTAPDPKLIGGVTQLKIEDLRPGAGAPAKSGDHVSMNYKGTLLDGSVFDQSYGREPFDFDLGSGSVIKGWDEGIVGMKKGGKRKLTIPADKAYGSAGRPPKIPGGATLVFEVELLEISQSSG